MDLERYIGGGVLENVPGTRVELRRPDIELRIDVDNETVRVFGDKQQGLGGFPLPTQETVVSLLSGGFDSSVASFQLLRRGARTHFASLILVVTVMRRAYDRPPIISGEPMPARIR